MDFEEYIRQGEPNAKEKASAWQTAIGLQAVDGLKTSDYLKETARKHIEGEIDIDEAQQLIKSYYQSKTARLPEDDDMEEADKVSANITRILNETSFAFSIVGFTSIHKRLFNGVFKFAGKIRDYDITKKEWVLQGDTVLYVNSQDIRKALEYDLEQEKAFDYKGLSFDRIVEHIAKFVSGIWQIHPFGEGNTRTTAVFTIKYLRSIGFEVDNSLFAEHSWYFRNALVRANYRNVRKGIEPDNQFLLKFFRNLLMGEKNELKNRFMVVNSPETWRNETDETGQVTGQVTGQAHENMQPSTEFIYALILQMGEKQMSVKQLMEALGLKGRDNFLNTYLNPGIKEGFVTLLYPESPRHPRQKYYLTVKGVGLYSDLITKENDDTK
ncbi:MAG: Fic family protein [Mediterranea sp.]|jgi:fido (protein-threonine AMPylation protein)|nr:Fic family protein [Mediterranea sp.]